MTEKILGIVVLAWFACIGVWAQKAKNHNLEVAKNLDIFNNVYKSLDLMYVDTLNASETIGVGIDAMLRSLDPYTEYYPESKTKDLKMMLTGKYAGIGSIIRYHQKLKKVVIDEPYEGMPAAEVGLRKGDVILSIDDSTMVGKDVSCVSSHLRGDTGTTFVLKVYRPTTKQEMKFKVTRQNIKLPEITYYGMRSGDIGYINFNQFTDESAKEMRRAYVSLRNQGAKKLILDLRGNGGGSVSEAVDIINMWLPKGQTILETKGKLTRSNREYKTKYEPIDTVMPIVVLVNGESASASEITAGTMQDLDRGIIVGTRTYGKGLVQVPMEMPYNTNLKLTTAKYYIPSGRCIQAINYKHSGGGYKEHIPDSLTKVFFTKNGRKVRDGGGIMPDVEVKPDTLPNIGAYLDRIDSTEVMFDYIVDYLYKHPTIAPASKFRLTDDEFDEFKSRVVSSGFTYDPMSEKAYDELVRLAKFEGYYDDAKAEFDSLKAKLKHDIAHDLDRNKKVIKRMVEQEIITAKYYQAGAMEASLRDDKQLKRAEDILNDEAEYRLLLVAKKNENATK